MPNLYLGNINAANNIDFLQKKNNSSIVNCSNEIEFHEYFMDKYKNFYVLYMRKIKYQYGHTLIRGNRKRTISQ